MEIKLEHVSKTIRKNTVIKDISSHWTGGTVYGLKGYNGAGKTMLMRLISGLIRPTEGKILIDEKELGVDISFPEDMGLLLEHPGFLESYSGIQNLRLIAQLRGKIGEDGILSVLDRVGLTQNAEKKYRKYSLGMKQRLGLAAAVMEQPALILLDEPTNALDADGIEMVKQLVREEKTRCVDYFGLP